MGIKGSEKNTGRFPAEYKAYAAGDSSKKESGDRRYRDGVSNEQSKNRSRVFDRSIFPATTNKARYLFADTIKMLL